MEYIIVVNPQANRIRTNPLLLREILSRFHAYAAEIFYAKSIASLHARLNLYRGENDLSKATICIVGGDGTFKQILEWTIQLPIEEQPALMPVGGGQFNFMTRYVGFKSGDPIKNLSRLFSSESQTQQKCWRPIQVHDSFSETYRHGAVVANGVVTDTVEWYAQNGKGNYIHLISLITSVLVDYAKNVLMGKEGRVRQINGVLIADDTRIEANRFAGIAIGAVDEFIKTCRPFHKPILDDQCGTIAYWGHLGKLALATPAIWFGKKVPFIMPTMMNTNVKEIVFRTDEHKMVIDGDCFSWPKPKGEKPIRTFTFTRGPEITLLHVM